MSRDPREQAARFYDLNPGSPDDFPFYRSRIKHKNIHILELGCGTGRITLPLSRFCDFIHGIDLVMRCCFPADFENLIADRGFEVIGRWGGYSGEAYGVGPELVIEFSQTAHF